MKRIGLVCLGLALGAASTVHAQGLTMQMSNGWNFTFSGNVNSFLYYTQTNTGGTTATIGGIVPPNGTVRATRITVGLLPAFAVFDAKGKEGNTDLGVHFGFAPSVQCGQGVNDCFGTTIDMRQVYLTFGGSWGQFLVGRELGLFSRQNILTDQTLFGVGGSGASGPDPIAFGDRGGSTTLGRIGLGYVYPQFRAQITYSTPAGRPYSWAIGVFEAAQVGMYNQTQIPRVESEFTYSQSGFKFWLGGTLQSTKDAVTGGKSLTGWGGSGGLRYEQSMFSVTGSGYYGKAIGTTFYGLGGSSDDLANPGTDDARKSYGFIGQITVTPTASKLTIAGSYGSSYLKASNNDKTLGNDFRTENTLISGGLYYQATKSLKVVGEFDYEWTKGKVGGVNVGEKNTRWTPALGFMLFF